MKNTYMCIYMIYTHIFMYFIFIQTYTFKLYISIHFICKIYICYIHFIYVHPFFIYVHVCMYCVCVYAQACVFILLFLFLWQSPGWYRDYAELFCFLFQMSSPLFFISHRSVLAAMSGSSAFCLVIGISKWETLGGNREAGDGIFIHQIHSQQVTAT